MDKKEPNVKSKTEELAQAETNMVDDLRRALFRERHENISLKKRILELEEQLLLREISNTYPDMLQRK